MALDIKALIEQQHSLMREVNDFVYQHPELGYEEHQCAAFLVKVFQRLGLEVQQPVNQIDTAFTATLKGPQTGPRVGWVLLYDAVPTVNADFTHRPNHSCGHNVIAGAVAGAVGALAQASIPGELVVVGVPGDEIAAPVVCGSGGSKGLTAAAGLWDDFDAVFYTHPEFSNTVSQVSRWMERYRITLHQPRRMSQRGELAGSVLWAVNALLEALREMEAEHSQEFVMIKDLAVDGDVEADCQVNARMQVLLFGLNQAEVVQRRQRLLQVLDEVSASSEIDLQLELIGEPYMGIQPNPTLTTVVQQALRATELSVLVDPQPLPFATDFGNISRRAPSALIGIGRKGGWQFHTLEGAKEFDSPDAHQVMVHTAEVLARATTQLGEDPTLVEAARAEFNATKEGEHETDSC